MEHRATLARVRNASRRRCGNNPVSPAADDHPGGARALCGGRGRAGRRGPVVGIPVGETVAGKGAMQEDTLLTLGGVGVSGAGSAGKLTPRGRPGAVRRHAPYGLRNRLAIPVQHPDVKFVSINVNGHDATNRCIWRSWPTCVRRWPRCWLRESRRVRPNPAYLEDIVVAGQTGMAGPARTRGLSGMWARP